MLRVPRAPQSNGHCRTKLSSSVWKENAEPALPRALAVLFHISEDIPGPLDPPTKSPSPQYSKHYYHRGPRRVGRAYLLEVPSLS